ncbi:MAG: MBG domain-containing protein, partial [Verrucomicrobiota bacterium]
TPPVNVGSYSVVATVTGGNYSGQATGVFTISKGHQAISITPLAGDTPLKDRTGPVQLAATSTAGLPVQLSLAADSAATLNSSNQLVAIQSTGKVTIRANQPGDSNVFAASEVLLELDVTKLNQAITFSQLPNVQYGSPTIVLSATATSGLFPAFAVARGPAVLLDSFLQLTGAGEIFVRVTQAGNSVFNAAPEINQRVGVAQKFQEILFPALADATYGETVALLATANSELPVSYRVVSGPAVVNGSSLVLTGIGTVVVRAGQPGNAGIAAAPEIERSFRVSPKPLVVTANSVTRVYGAPNPVWSLTYEGFVAGDSPAVFTTPIVIATSAGPASGPATYPLTLSGGAAANYTLTLRGGTVTVVKAPQVISFPPLADQTLGNPPLALSASVDSGLPVALSLISGPAALAGSNLTLTGAGQVTLRASRAATAEFEAAADVDQSFIVWNDVVVVATTSSLSSGGFTTGAVIPIQLVFSSPVTVSGAPTLALNASAQRVATYAAGSGSAVLTFNYTVQAGDNVLKLDYRASDALSAASGGLRGSSGATVVLTLPTPGAAGSLAAVKDFRIDTLAPGLVRFDSSTPGGTYRTGETVVISAVLTEPLRAGGALVARLTTGASVTLTSTAESAVLTGRYVIGAGENTRSLEITQLSLSGNPPRDLAGNSLANLTLPSGGNTLAAAKRFVIGTPGPTISITADRSRLSGAQTATIRFKTSEETGDFGVEDVQVENGTLSGFSGRGREYTVVYTPAVGV